MLVTFTLGPSNATVLSIKSPAEERKKCHLSILSTERGRTMQAQGTRHSSNNVNCCSGGLPATGVGSG